MARKETEGLVEMFLEMEAKQELIDRQERINKRIDALKKELKEISNRAYQAAVGKVVAQYQEKMSDESLPVSELEKIAQERKEFEANPEKYGITLEKSPIVDENDQKRALQIVELLLLSPCPFTGKGCPKDGKGVVRDRWGGSFFTQT